MVGKISAARYRFPIGAVGLETYHILGTAYERQ